MRESDRRRERKISSESSGRSGPVCYRPPDRNQGWTLQMCAHVRPGGRFRGRTSSLHRYFTSHSPHLSPFPLSPTLHVIRTANCRPAGVGFRVPTTELYAVPSAASLNDYVSTPVKKKSSLQSVRPTFSDGDGIRILT